MSRIFVTLIAVVLAIASIGIVMAQQSTSGNSGSRDQNRTSITKSNGDINSAATFDGVGNCCQQMTDEFTKLHEHFGQMMKITDMKILKVEMQKHNDMMVTLHKKMMAMKGVKSEASSDDNHMQHGH